MIVSLFPKERRITFRYSDDLARVIPRSHQGFCLGAILSSRPLASVRNGSARSFRSSTRTPRSRISTPDERTVSTRRDRGRPHRGSPFQQRRSLSRSWAKARRCGAAAPLTDRRTTASGGWRRAAYPAKSGRGLAGRSATGSGGFLPVRSREARYKKRTLAPEAAGLLLRSHFSHSACAHGRGPRSAPRQVPPFRGSGAGHGLGSRLPAPKRRKGSWSPPASSPPPAR